MSKWECHFEDTKSLLLIIGMQSKKEVEISFQEAVKINNVAKVKVRE
jgi:hypothetical protein